jgi:hypothetical protein
MLSGDVDLMRGDGEITSGGELTVVYRANSDSVRGKVESCGAGTVLLVPGDPALRGRGWSRAGACDQAGNYEVNGVPPGEYAAVALAGNSPVPPIDDWMLQRAASVTVRAGDMASLDLKCTAYPGY